jgi:hypothetical protein
MFRKIGVEGNETHDFVLMYVLFPFVLEIPIQDTNPKELKNQANVPELLPLRVHLLTCLFLLCAHFTFTSGNFTWRLTL